MRLSSRTIDRFIYASIWLLLPEKNAHTHIELKPSQQSTNVWYANTSNPGHMCVALRPLVQCDLSPSRIVFFHRTNTCIPITIFCRQNHLGLCWMPCTLFTLLLFLLLLLFISFLFFLHLDFFWPLGCCFCNWSLCFFLFFVFSLFFSFFLILLFLILVLAWSSSLDIFSLFSPTFVPSWWNYASFESKFVCFYFQFSPFRAVHPASRLVWSPFFSKRTFDQCHFVCVGDHSSVNFCEKSNHKVLTKSIWTMFSVFQRINLGWFSASDSSLKPKLDQNQISSRQHHRCATQSQRCIASLETDDEEEEEEASEKSIFKTKLNKRKEKKQQNQTKRGKAKSREKKKQHHLQNDKAEKKTK